MNVDSFPRPSAMRPSSSSSWGHAYTCSRLIFNVLQPDRWQQFVGRVSMSSSRRAVSRFDKLFIERSVCDQKLTRCCRVACVNTCHPSLWSLYWKNTLFRFNIKSLLNFCSIASLIIKSLRSLSSIISKRLAFQFAVVGRKPENHISNHFCHQQKLMTLYIVFAIGHDFHRFSLCHVFLTFDRSSKFISFPSTFSFFQKIQKICVGWSQSVQSRSLRFIPSSQIKSTRKTGRPNTG